jgi:hypothetical protein
MVIAPSDFAASGWLTSSYREALTLAAFLLQNSCGALVTVGLFGHIIRFERARLHKPSRNIKQLGKTATPLAVAFMRRL